MGQLTLSGLIETPAFNSGKQLLASDLNKAYNQANKITKALSEALKPFYNGDDVSWNPENGLANDLKTYMSNALANLNVATATKWASSVSITIKDSTETYSGATQQLLGNEGTLTLKLPSTILATYTHHTVSDSNQNYYLTGFDSYATGATDEIYSFENLKYNPSTTILSTPNLSTGCLNATSVSFTTISSSFIPDANTYNIGSSTYKFANIYATTFNGSLSGTAEVASKLKTTIDSSNNIYLIGSRTTTTSSDGEDIYKSSGVYVHNGTQLIASSYDTTSDQRLKKNIVNFSCKKSILDLPIKEFDYIADNSHHIGCIAQDLQKICPEIVFENEDGYLYIEETKLVYLLIQEVKKLKSELSLIKKNGGD